MIAAHTTYTIVALAWLSLGRWASPPAAQACAGETPEETFVHVAAFMAEGDLGGMASCLTPEARRKAADEMFRLVALMASMASIKLETYDEAREARDDAHPLPPDERAASESLLAGYADLLAAHGLADPEAEEMDDAAQAAQLAGVDQVALIADIVELLRSLDPSGPGLQATLGELSELVVDGDFAHGTVDGKPFVFTRIEGLWYAQPPGL